MTLWGLSAARGLYVRHYGAWSLNALAGADGAGLYARALSVQTAPLAPPVREIMRFTLARDQNGQTLNEACVYELAGAGLPARWWSITIYAPNGQLPHNSDHAFAIDAARVGRGPWRARLSAVRGDAIYWISTRGARARFTLALRLYQPLQEAREHPETIPFPALTAVSCPGAAA